MVGLGPVEFRSQLIPPVLKLLRAADEDVAEIVKRYELPSDAIDRREVIVPLEVWHRLQREAAWRLHDDALGLHLAQMTPRGSYGVLEFTTRSAPNLREAFLRICRYSTLLNSASVIELPSDGKVTRFVQRMPGAPLAAGPVGNEFSMGITVRFARELSGREVNPITVWFAHPRTKGIDELAAFFGTEDLRFEAGENAFSVPDEVMQLPIISADPELFAVLEEQAMALASTRAKPVDLKSQVEDQVRRMLREGEPSIGTVAKSLGTSARTLQRRLSEQKVTFNELVDSVRAGVSKELLKNADLALGEIAFLLGYSEMSPFVRAFKRWTGKTPGEYRQTTR